MVCLASATALCLAWSTVFDEGEGGEAACRGCVLQGNREVWIRVIGSLSGNVFIFGFVTSYVYF